jgi:hypothetical protein
MTLGQGRIENFFKFLLRNAAVPPLTCPELPCNPLSVPPLYANMTLRHAAPCGAGLQHPDPATSAKVDAQDDKETYR